MNDARALVIGINDYAKQPLTSAVNDAVAFRRTLIDLQLVDDANIVLLTSPQTVDAAGDATKSEILAHFYDAYASGDEWPRWYFYFSGHGLLASANIEGSKKRTALVAADTTGARGAGANIDLDDLLGVMQMTGPAEQFYFIDACRDMHYVKQPSVAPVAWEAAERGPERIQRCLYAVSPLGAAAGTHGGMGSWTTDLITGLRDQYAALEYDPPRDAYQITMQSVFSYVWARTESRVSTEEVWMKKYILPDIFSRGAGPAVLRSFANVPPVRFTVHITPESAATSTQVLLERSRAKLDANSCYPDRRNHEPVELEPQWHRITASSTVGIAVPSNIPIDLRTTREVTIRVGGPPPEPAPPDTGGIPPKITPRAAPLDSSAQARTGVDATAFEPTTDIALSAFNSPNERWAGSGALHQDVPPGAYHIEFRLGSDVYSQGDFFVGHDERIEITAQAESSPLLIEALGSDNTADGGQTVAISDSVGKMQSGVLATILPLIGIEALDFCNVVTDWYSTLLDAADSADYGGRPLSVVVAIDGTAWKSPILSLLDGIEVDVVRQDGDRKRIPLKRLSISTLGSETVSPDRGFQRVRTGMVSAPEEPFTLRVFIPNIGDSFIASASLAQRTTVATFLARPDGSVHVSQSLTTLPHEDEPPPWNRESGRANTFGEVFRLSQLAQKLYENDQLWEKATALPASALGGFIDDLLHAKWRDPVLGCMGYYAGRRAKGPVVSPDFLDEARCNLTTFFGALPDVAVIEALHTWDGVSSSTGFERLLDSGAVPLLAQSVQHIAQYCISQRRFNHAFVELARSITPAQPWTKSMLPFPMRELVPA